MWSYSVSMFFKETQFLCDIRTAKMYYLFFFFSVSYTAVFTHKAVLWKSRTVLTIRCLQIDQLWVVLSGASHIGF